MKPISKDSSGIKPTIGRNVNMPLLQLVPSEVCFRCDVCCRFPEPESFLRPYFTSDEIQRAVARGISPAHFSDPHGCQISVVPNPSGEGHLCPAFDLATSHCRIYEDRPLDCQIYPLAIMWNADRSAVVLGWDTKCPFMRDAVPSEILAYAGTVAVMFERDDLLATVASNQRLIGRFQEDVIILRPLSKLSEKLAHVRVELSPLTSADHDLLREALARVNTPLAHYALPPHLIWKDLFRYAWTEIAGHACLFAEYTDGLFMPLPPLGAAPHRAAFERAFAIMRKRNGGSAVSRIENVPEEWKATLEAWGYRVQSKDPDYLYRTSSLVELAGDRYKSQRAACNRFGREHRHSFEPYWDSDRDACLALFREWAAQKQAAGIGETERHMLGDSEAAHREALTHHRTLGLAGHVVRIDGAVRAYTFGYERSPSVFCVLLEVADRSILGLAQFTFRECCRAAAGRGHEFVNTMDDSGLQSLAQSKRAYHPVALVPSYIVTEA